MRRLLVVAVLGGCAGPIRPAVTPALSELPADPQKRDAVLDSAGAQPGPEQRKPLPSKLNKVETAAATAAAVLGSMFSKSKNVTLGVAAPVDENRVFAPPPRVPARKATEPDQKKERGAEQTTEGAGDERPAAAPEPGTSPAELVPWVRLK